jgi:hypothetical protein
MDHMDAGFGWDLGHGAWKGRLGLVEGDLFGLMEILVYEVL